MSDRGEGIAKSFGGLGFYRGCSIIFAPLEKTATSNSKHLSFSPANERDTPNQIKTSNQASKHLLELQKEIKEEEDEIFADINSLIDSRSNLYFAFGDDDDDGVNVEPIEKTRSLVKLDGDENLPIGDFLLQSQLNNNHHINPEYNYNNNNSSNNNNNSTGLRQNLRLVSEQQQQQQPPSPHLPHSHQLRNNHHQQHRYRHHKIDEPLFINDSDDINDYASTSADDTNTNDYQSESFTGAHSTSSGTNDITQQMTSDKVSQSYISRRSKSTAETRQTADHQLTEDEDNDQYFHEENNDLYLSEEKLHEQEVREEQQENDDATALQEHYMDEHVFSANITDPQQYQAIQEVKQQVQNNLPKPCVFFLEGNCRRSDCKYSHDLSNITCKYWIEGFCFKGELCPFLHSYNLPVDSNLLDSDELDLLAKKQLNPTFAIESEADFPSLPLDALPSTLNDSTKSSINTDSAATDIKHQILSGNPAVVFKIAKKKRKRG